MQKRRKRKKQNINKNKLMRERSYLPTDYVNFIQSNDIIILRVLIASKIVYKNEKSKKNNNTKMALSFADSKNEILIYYNDKNAKPVVGITGNKE